MPELPEVETIRRELGSRITGQNIRGCRVLRPDVIAFPRTNVFCQHLTNEAISCVTREGKYLIMMLVSGKKLIFHLRLSGTISVKPCRTAPERFTRVIISLDDYELFFNEPRVLGRIYLVQKNSVKGMPGGLLSLGLEPICPAFDVRYLRGQLMKRKAFIKTLLLDQRICAGVGNIYSDEALFHAGVRPTRRAHRITRRESDALVVSLKNVLNKAIKKFGTSVSDYVRIDGKDGSFQQFLHVYQREGQPCRVCGTLIKVRKIGNRRTRYCPKCQK
jgi:formamidopyrimidine-DNA glycosylase